MKERLMNRLLIKKKGFTTVQYAGIVLVCICIAAAIITYGDKVLHWGQTNNAYNMGTGWERFDDNHDEQFLEGDEIEHFMQGGEDAP